MKLKTSAGRLCAILIVTGMVCLPAGCGLYGLKPYVVLSGSMEPELPVGSVILTTTHPDRIGTQDVITYRAGQQLVTHRVSRIEGESLFTKGDANPSEDPCPVKADQIAGKVISCIPYAGYLVIWLQRPYILFLLFAAVLLLLLMKKAHTRKRRSVS